MTLATDAKLYLFTDAELLYDRNSSKLKNQALYYQTVAILKKTYILNHVWTSPPNHFKLFFIGHFLQFTSTFGYQQIFSDSGSTWTSPQITDVLEMCSIQFPQPPGFHREIQQAFSVHTHTYRT